MTVAAMLAFPGLSIHSDPSATCSSTSSTVAAVVGRRQSASAALTETIDEDPGHQFRYRVLSMTGFQLTTFPSSTSDGNKVYKSK